MNADRFSGQVALVAGAAAGIGAATARRGSLDLGGGGGYGQTLSAPTIAAHNETVGNYVHHFMLSGHDGGASYTLGAQPDSVENDDYYANGPDVGNLYAMCWTSVSPRSRAGSRTCCGGF